MMAAGEVVFCWKNFGATNFGRSEAIGIPCQGVRVTGLKYRSTSWIFGLRSNPLIDPNTHNVSHTPWREALTEFFGGRLVATLPDVREVGISLAFFGFDPSEIAGGYDTLAFSYIHVLE